MTSSCRLSVGSSVANFSDLKFTLPTVEVIGGEKLEAATINYGNFIQTTLDFLIVAFCVFMLIKVVNKLTAKKKEEETSLPRHLRLRNLAMRRNS